MILSKVVTETNINPGNAGTEFEIKLNTELKKIKDDKLIDVKITSASYGDRFVITAVILYKSQER